jgi:U3 small nucleolar RNA-associated protein MPP10
MPERIDLLDPQMEEALGELVGNTNAKDIPRVSSEESYTSSDSEEASPKHARIDSDFDAMLGGAAAASRSGTSEASTYSDEQRETGRSEDKAEKLPCEDEFLRLADMEAFVQQGEAAEERGNRGGLSDIDDAAELGAEATGELGTIAGGAWALAGRRRHVENDTDGSGDGDEALEYGDHGRGRVEVDLFEMSDAEEVGSGRDEGVGIMHDDFFGPQPASGRHRACAKRLASAAAGTLEEASSGDHLSLEEEQKEPGVESPHFGEAAQNNGSAELSTHEKRVLRIREQIAAMEEAALQDQEWHLRGEASAASRPMDSALAIDLDFETTLRPPPQPTIEAAQALEELIKARIRDMRFDNVVRVRVASPRKERTALELDNSRSNAGLADVYAEEFVERTSGVRADKQAGVRAVCISLSIM